MSPVTMGNQAVGVHAILDLVFLIDGSGSMQNLLDAVKNNALTLYPKIVDALAKKKRIIDTARVKVAVFGDIYVDNSWYVESDFFSLQNDAESFRAFVEGVRAMGGGDEPESGLEALHNVLHSEWNNDPNYIKGRQIIILMTDASAHSLEDPQRSKDPLYPAGMPKNLAELFSEWVNDDVIKQSAKRLAIFAPNVSPWIEISQDWEEASISFCEPGKGMTEEVLEPVIKYIAGSF